MNDRRNHPRCTPPVQTRPVNRQMSTLPAAEQALKGLAAAAAVSPCDKLTGMAREMCYYARSGG